MKKLFIILAILLIVVLASTSAVLAAGNIHDQVDGQVNVIELVPGIETYSDAEATTPVVTMDFGDVKPGHSANVTVYVKNTGDLDFTSVHIATWMSGGGGALDFGSMGYSTNDFALTTGNVQEVTLTLTINGGVGPGIKPFYSDIGAVYN